MSNSSLKMVAETFGKIGWDKRLCDLSEEEVVGMIVVFQSIKEIDDEYLSQHLAEVYLRYGPERDADWGIPFFTM